MGEGRELPMLKTGHPAKNLGPPGRAGCSRRRGPALEREGWLLETEGSFFW